VYCDLVGPQLFGDTLARCLRTLQYPSPDGYHVFDKVYYVHVEKTDFQTVALRLLTILGDRVLFSDSVKLLVAASFSSARIPRINRGLGMAPRHVDMGSLTDYYIRQGVG
jgi:hypothetical protein